MNKLLVIPIICLSVVTIGKAAENDIKIATEKQHGVLVSEKVNRQAGLSEPPSAKRDPTLVKKKRNMVTRAMKKAKLEKRKAQNLLNGPIPLKGWISKLDLDSLKSGKATISSWAKIFLRDHPNFISEFPSSEFNIDFLDLCYLISEVAVIVKKENFIDGVTAKILSKLALNADKSSLEVSILEKLTFLKYVLTASRLEDKKGMYTKKLENFCDVDEILKLKLNDDSKVSLERRLKQISENDGDLSLAAFNMLGELDL